MQPLNSFHTVYYKLMHMYGRAQILIHLIDDQFKAWLVVGIFTQMRNDAKLPLVSLTESM